MTEDGRNNDTTESEDVLAHNKYKRTSIPDGVDDIRHFLNSWRTEEGFQTDPPRLLEGENYSSRQIMGLSTDQAFQIIEKVASNGPRSITGSMKSYAGLNFNYNPQGLGPGSFFIPYAADNQDDARIPGGDVVESLVDIFDGLMMTEMHNRDTHVADVLMGPILKTGKEYENSILDLMGQAEKTAALNACEKLLGEENLEKGDIGHLDFMLYQDDNPVSEEGFLETNEPAVITHHIEDDQLYMIPNDIWLEISEEGSSETAFIGSVYNGYVELGDAVYHPPEAGRQEVENTNFEELSIPYNVSV